jgi:cystathionine beta-lyase/cystathionine gamma-synthase
MDIRTRVVHGGDNPRDVNGAVSVPIYASATFSHPGVGESTGFDYSRIENPTRSHLERLIADLEYGVDAVACSTGMAAVACVGELFAPGDHIIHSGDLYGGSIRYFRTVMAKNGVRFDAVDTSDTSAIEACLRPETKAIFVETPTNPMMHVTDIAAVAAVAQRHGLLLIVDNTFLSPYFQNPLQLGANIVIHSGTKYLGGHNDSLAGYVVVDSQDLAERIRAIFGSIGFALGPFDAWLQIRGIKTLALRMEAAQASALVIAQWLRSQPKVTNVFYAGLPDHPGYQTSIRQARGFGAMLSFETDTVDTATALLNRVSTIQYAESLGGVESLITYPYTQTHADVPEDERRERGINERLLRLSVGIEATADLIADLEQALA